MYLCPDYQMCKYTCGVCGVKSKRNEEGAFYFCRTCPYKVCENCIVNKWAWRQHKCPPRRSARLRLVSQHASSVLGTDGSDVGSSANPQ